LKRLANSRLLSTGRDRFLSLNLHRERKVRPSKGAVRSTENRSAVTTPALEVDWLAASGHDEVAIVMRGRSDRRHGFCSRQIEKVLIKNKSR